MKMFLDIDIKSPSNRINYRDKILVVGSCFTEHIGGRLHDLKFPVLQNPNGILFDPVSVASSLSSYIQNRQYVEQDLFYLNELWQSWQHHSIFSGLQKEEVLAKINQSQQQAHNFLKTANWLIVTLGSSFSYALSENEQAVANCHRAPGQWFNKNLTPTEVIVGQLSSTLKELFAFNPTINIIFTISPVRHIRDGVVENNRSKARLIEAVHTLIEQFQQAHYFPAYELIIDVLRDYRFYDIDLVHPNYAATEFVFEKFTTNFIDVETTTLMEEVKKIVTAAKHKPFHAESKAHQSFINKTLDAAVKLQNKYPYIDLSKVGYKLKYQSFNEEHFYRTVISHGLHQFIFSKYYSVIRWADTRLKE